jgi:hypothetical protein
VLELPRLTFAKALVSGRIDAAATLRASLPTLNRRAAASHALAKPLSLQTIPG